MLLGLGVELDQIVEGSITNLHDRRHHRHVCKCSPCKRLILFFRTFFLVRSIGACTGLNVVDVIFSRLLLFQLRRSGRCNIIRLCRSVCVRSTDVICIHVLNSIQCEILCSFNRNAGSTCVAELCIVPRCAKLEFKRLSNLICKPSLFGKIFVIIRDVNRMRSSESSIHSVHLRKVLTSGFRECDRCHRSNICSRMRALHAILKIISNIGPLRNPKGTIITSHRLEGRQNHRSLAVNRNGLSTNLNMLIVHNGVNWKFKLHSIVVESGKILRLEELFKARKERLHRLHRPHRSVQLRHTMDLQRYGCRSQILSHCEMSRRGKLKNKRRGEQDDAELQS